MNRGLALLLLASAAFAQPTYTITPATLPQAARGVSYFVQLSTDVPQPVQYAIVEGALPAGLTMSTTGLISGTPQVIGTFNIFVRATGPLQQTAGANYNLVVTVAPLVINTSALPDAIAGSPYSTSLSASGGTPPYFWSLQSGQLPIGMRLQPDGTITGSPQTAGTFTFTASVVDSAQQFASRAFNLRVLSNMVVTSTILPNATVGVGYSQQLTVSGGTAPYAWEVNALTIPPGFSLTPQGLLSGTATTAGTYAIGVAVNDSLGARASGTVNLTVVTAPLTITTATLPAPALGTAYSQRIQAQGGTPPYRFTVISGSLPAGISLLPDGTLNGSPTAPGSATFTVLVVDAANGRATKDYTVQITGSAPVITATTFPAGAVGTPYSQAPTVTGGTVPYTFSISSGSLPAGLSINSTTGEIAGTPTTAGSYTFTIQVVDKFNQTGTRSFTLQIAAVMSITTASPFAPLRVGTASTLSLAASGGTGPYTWSVLSGSLPAGLTLNPDSGAITGTPTTAGTYGFAAQVTDVNRLTASKSFTGSVVAALTITTPSLPAGTVGSSYSQPIAVNGGITPVAFTITGSLPPGLTMTSSSGVISGTPSAAGSFDFTVVATDAGQVAARKPFTIAVGLPQVSSVTIGGVSDAVQPAQQPRVTVALGSAYPVAVTGTVTLTFAPNATVNSDDPAIQFSTGGRTATFNVPAGSTQAVFTTPDLAIQTGTVAGTITLTTALQAGGNPVTCGCPLTKTVQVARSVPVISSVRIAAVTGGFNVVVIGFSTTREITSATFHFTPSSGNTLQTTDVTMPVGTAFTTWYQSSASNAFGSQFLLTQPFNVQGVSGAVGTVSVTLTNTQGTSQAVSATF
jgi:hypothetical protein